MSISQETYEKLQKLINWFRDAESVLVAFSGGVDSSVVAVVARYAIGDKAVAVTANSPLLPPSELEEAINIAKQQNLRHLVLEVDELKNPNLVRNPQNRCYFCKKELMSILKKVASELNLKVVVDGTNSDDLRMHRPGFLALVEEGIRSPLAEVGITKGEVREIARYFKLSNSEKPSMACIASRFPYGQEITHDKIKRVVQAEKLIRENVNVTQLRVRDYGNTARIEVLPNERKFFFNEELLDKITKKLKSLGYVYVTLDLEGYRTGSMDEVIERKIIPIERSKKN
jgi:uncharacterized protein